MTKGQRLKRAQPLQLLRSWFGRSILLHRNMSLCPSMPLLVTAMDKNNARHSRHPSPAPGGLDRPCRAISTTSPNPWSNLPRPCPWMGMSPFVQFICMDQSVWVSEPLPTGSPHPWHMIGALGNTAWHPPEDHRAPVLTMGDWARDWRWQGARHKVHSRTTSYEKTSQYQSRFLSRVSTALPSGSSAPPECFCGLCFPHLQNEDIPSPTSRLGNHDNQWAD
jgi:hypothetical protein